MKKDPLNKFFFKPEGKGARELYYEQVKKQYALGTELSLFMIEARRRGYKMKVHIEVDGVFSHSSDIILERKEGRDLLEYFAEWILGVRMKDNEELLEMERLWPDLPKADPAEHICPNADPIGGGLRIDPDGP